MSVDLTTKFGGLTLASPLVIGACPLTAVELTRAAFVSAGASAVVLPSLFEVQVEEWNRQNGFADETNPRRSRKRRSRKRDARLSRSLNTVEDANTYLRMIEQASSQEPVPVIASINGECNSDLADFGRHLESAGASAIELNFRSPSDEECCDPRDVEDGIVEIARHLSDAISIPLFLKLGRHYSSLSHLACRLKGTASGLVLFGSAPEIDISLETLQLTARWGLTEPGSVANSIESIMQVKAFCPELPLAASGGIAGSGDIAKALLAGADVVMVTSAVYRDGPEALRLLLDGLKIFMERHGIQSLQELQAIRPKPFDMKEEQVDNVSVLDAELDSHGTGLEMSVIECDRWGHIRPAS